MKSLDKLLSLDWLKKVHCQSISNGCTCCTYIDNLAMYKSLEAMDVKVSFYN